ncbi:efflux RND transporter permease subunit [Sandaracinomonas limnophila]|nr:efflux RND transporter permease subunit [Sandaracinomonas limnophila]
MWAISFLSIFMVFEISQLKISYDFDSYFAKNESFYQDFEKYQSKFPLGQNHQIVVTLESQVGIDSSFGSKANAVFAEIEQLKGIKKANYFSKISEFNPSNLNGGEKKLVDFKSESSFQESMQYFKSRSKIYQSFFSKDQKSVVGYFTIEKELFNLPGRDTLIHSIRQIVTSSKVKFHLFGIPVMRSIYSEKIWNDFLVFSIVSIALLVLVLYYLFRHFLLILIPCLTVVMGILWNFGLMSLFGFSINMISNLLVPILFVVGISDSIHLISVFYEKIQHGLKKEDAIIESLKEVGKATFLTALVSSTGFLSLSFTSAEAIKFFGLFGFTGIIITYFLSIVIVPSLLLVLDENFFYKQTSVLNQGIWTKVFSGIYSLAHEQKKKVLLIFSFFVLISILLIPQIKTSLFFTNDVKSKDALAQEFSYFEKNIGYLKPFEFVIRTKAESQPINLAFVKGIEKIEKELSNDSNFGAIYSMIFQLKYANYLLHQGKMEYFTIPNSEDKLRYLLKEISNRADEPLFNLNGKKEFYFASKIRDEGSEVMEKKEIQLKHKIESSLPVQVKFTGFGHVLDQSNKSSRTDIFWGLLGDLIVVSLMMAFLFKKSKFILISLLPNLIPLCLLLGIIALLGIPFSPANALILVVIFGISIDDTIHFLTHYLLIRKEDSQAIRSTLLTCGKAMLFVSFLLMAGLGITYFSDFEAISNLGLFGMITIIFATLTEFLITPILLDLFDPI